MNRIILMIALLVLVGALQGCSVIGDIFKAGVWVGVLAVLAIVGLIIFLVARASGKK